MCVQEAPVTQESVDAAGLRGWTVSDSGLTVTFDCDGFTAAGAFVAAITALADGHNHHPDLSVSYPGHVRIITVSHDVGELTRRDLRLATAVHRLAAESGYTVVSEE